jgi:hypothetical protein
MICGEVPGSPNVNGTYRPSPLIGPTRGSGQPRAGGRVSGVTRPVRRSRSSHDSPSTTTRSSSIGSTAGYETREASVAGSSRAARCSVADEPTLASMNASGPMSTHSPCEVSATGRVPHSTGRAGRRSRPSSPTSRSVQPVRSRYSASQTPAPSAEAAG